MFKTVADVDSKAKQIIASLNGMTTFEDFKKKYNFGKKRKSRKSRKSKKSRKSRKSRKSKKSRK